MSIGSGSAFLDLDGSGSVHRMRSFQMYVAVYARTLIVEFDRGNSPSASFTLSKLALIFRANFSIAQAGVDPLWIPIRAAHVGRFFDSIKLLLEIFSIIRCSKTVFYTRNKIYRVNLQNR